MTEDLMTAFEEGLTALAAGEDLDLIVARYPALAAELRPMLEAARAATPPRAEPHRAQQNAHRAQFLTRAAVLRDRAAALRAPQVPRRSFFTRGWATALATFVALLLIATTTLNASADSVPGDTLYPLKRSLENVQLALAPNPTDRWQLAQHFTARRRAEVQQLLAQGRAAEVEFSGLLEARAENRWAVGGVPLEISASTPITGVPFVGLYVTVSGHTQNNGAVLAAALTVEGTQFYGRVTTQNSTQWTIEVIGLGAQTVRVDSRTVISGDPRVSDWATVHTRALPDGEAIALLIEARAETPAPLPSATPPPPTATATVPSATLSPTLTPQASATFEATRTAAPSSTAEPTRTPMPSLTRPPESSPTPAPSATEAETEGTLDSIADGAWVIGGITYAVNAETEIEDNPQVGETVRVNYWHYPDGTRVARRIRHP